MDAGVVYQLKGNSQSEQAEASSANPIAGNVQMRTLVELRDQLGAEAAGTGGFMHHHATAGLFH